MDELHHSVTRVGHMATSIHKELEEQSVMLEEIDAEVEDTTTLMNRSLRKIDKLLARAGEKGSLCIVLVLILVLIGVLVWLFYGT